MTIFTLPPRSALFLPASNARAIEKARGLDADLIILDLEDSVTADKKAEAREAAVAAVGQAFDKPVAIRINGIGTEWHAADIAAVAKSAADLVVQPKVESAKQLAATGKPLFAMIETPAGVLAATEIAQQIGVAGLIAGTNDLANELHAGSRAGLTLALQTIVLAARAANIVALDGVWNAITDLDGLEAESREGRMMGFDGKTLIHPSHLEPANRAYGPTATELEDARALIAAFKGGAERFRDRMIEGMHVEAAHRIVARAGV